MNNLVELNGNLSAKLTFFLIQTKQTAVFLTIKGTDMV